jgi:hypothetical protein
VLASLKDAINSEQGPSQLFAATLPLTLIEVGAPHAPSLSRDAWRERRATLTPAGLASRPPTPRWLAQIPYAAARFIVFDLASRALTDALPPLDEGGALAVSLAAGALAGAAASLVTHPLDTVVVRVCEGSSEAPSGEPSFAPDAGSASTDGRGAGDESDELCELPDGPDGLAGFVASLIKIGKEEGIGALFAGATTRAVYIATLSAVQFFLYEWAKQLLRVSRPDLELFFDVLSGLKLDN